MKPAATASDRNPKDTPPSAPRDAGAGGVRDGIERFRSALENLSPFTTVLSPEVRRLLQGVAAALPEAPRTDQRNSRGFSDSRLRYLELVGQLVSESTSPASHPERSPLYEYIINRIPAADHPCLRVCDSGITPTAEIKALLESDLHCLQQLAQTPISEFVASPQSLPPQPDRVDPSSRGAAASGNNGSPRLRWDLSEDLTRLRARFFEAAEWRTLAEPLIEFVRTHGAGIFQGTPAFSLRERGNRLELEPIADFDSFSLDWWQGNDSTIEPIVANTEHLLCGLPAHNVLIWGPRGCGKSSLIRGLVTRYYSRGLRGIQIPPHLYGRLREVYNLVRGRQERFAGVLDNISLDPRSAGFRELASVLDGGLERPPKNLVFYATSNFKDLVDREGDRPAGPPRQQIDRPSPLGETTTTSPRPGFYDPQQQQRLDERRAIDDRFALKVFLDLPGKREYDQLVLAYAERAGIAAKSDEVLAAFNVWRMRHNHDLAGGRTARDFVQWLYAREQSETRTA